MPQQLTFMAYVTNPDPAAKGRAVFTKMPTRTDTSGKTSTPGDGSDAPSRAAIQHPINASGSGVEQTTAVCSPSALLDTEPQPREVIHENSVRRSWSDEDFEDWLHQDKLSPEQNGDKPSAENTGSKRIQQPTPEYDDENTDDARRKRPRLAGGVCPNTLVDRGTTGGACQEEGGAESGPECQTTVQELASPINFGQLPKGRCTATNSPTRRTPSNNNASRGQDDARIIERSAYTCTMQTRALISALARAAALPLPRDKSNSEARVFSPSASAESCAVSGYQDAIQKSALVEQPVATQTQQSSRHQQATDLASRAASMDQRTEDLDQQAADLASRAASVDQRTEDLDQQAADLASRAAGLDQRAEDLDQQAADLASRAASVDQRTEDLDQQAADLASRAASLDQRAEDLDLQAADLASRAASMDQRVVHLDRRAADLDQRATSMDQRALDMDGPAAERPADLEERDADRNQRVADPHQQARAPPRQPSRASNQTLARQRCNMGAVGHFEEDDDFSGEDDASVCENEEDTNFSRGRLSQKQRHDLIQWSDQGKPLDWIAKKLNRRKENIEKLEKDARKLGIV